MEQEIDLNKIAEFMNSEPEDDVNINEVENTLDYIDTQLATVKKETKELVSGLPFYLDIFKNHHIIVFHVSI